MGFVAGEVEGLSGLLGGKAVEFCGDEGGEGRLSEGGKRGGGESGLFGRDEGAGGGKSFRGRFGVNV